MDQDFSRVLAWGAGHGDVCGGGGHKSEVEKEQQLVGQIGGVPSLV